MRRIPNIGRSAGALVIAGLALVPGCGPRTPSQEEVEAAREELTAKGIRLPPSTPEERAAAFPTHRQSPGKSAPRR